MRFFIIFLILIFVEKLHAQINSGARFMAMANAGTALEDVISLGNNQAGIASLKNPELALALQEHHFSTNVRSITAFLAFPTHIGVFGLYADRYNLKQDLSEFKGGLTLSRLFTSKFAIAGTLNYHQISISQFGISKALTFDLGLQYQLSVGWRIGVHFLNPFDLLQIKELFYRIPARIRVGTSYILSNQILLAVESEYTFDNYYDFRIGLEYSIINKLKLRGGTSFAPFKQYIGAGINLNKISVNAATSFHPQLGVSSQISLNYVF